MGRRFVALEGKKKSPAKIGDRWRFSGILNWSLSRFQELMKDEQIVDRSVRESETALMVGLLFDNIFHKQ